MMDALKRRKEEKMKNEKNTNKKLWRRKRSCEGRENIKEINDFNTWYLFQLLA